MPFEEFDKKIREAADNHHPAYNENAWDKMEGLLNKHLPEKKDKKRRALWLMLLFITAGGAGYLLLTDRPGNKPTVLNNRQVSEPGKDNNSTVTIKPGTHVTPGEKNAIPGSIPKENGSQKLSSTQSKLTPSKTIDQNSPLSIMQSNRKNKKYPLQNTNSIRNQDRDLTSFSDRPQTISPYPSINTSDDKTSQLLSSKNKPDAITPLPEQKQLVSATPVKQTLAEQLPAQNEKTGKTKKQKGNGLFLSLSVGPDIPAVRMDYVGKLRLAAGVGIGYKFGNRLSIQTGFYSTRKIYSSNAEDYNAPGWWWTYYPNLQKVDADCKVYEIPLLVNYNFTKNKKANWFGTIGLSSYLMKVEDYTYYFKAGTGQPTTRNWVYNNENKHYFSILTLGGGYEKTINKNFSLAFSPYFKMPLEGIGFGKVKLNSMGVLVSANYKPFAKNK